MNKRRKKSAGIKISIIIPTHQEDDKHLRSLASLRNLPEIEIIIADAKKMGRANRADQMNWGAKKARGNLLVFLHADTKVDPADLIKLSRLMNRRPELVGGAFRFALDQNHWKARWVEWGVFLRELVFQLPYGDQAIFIRRDIFQKIGGYPEVPLLEDILLIQKMKSVGKLFLYEGKAITSARRWEEFGYFQTTVANWLTALLWKSGLSLSKIADLRRRVFA